MKKVLLIMLLALATQFVVAQDDMTIVWEAKMGHQIDYYGTDISDKANSYSFAADDKKITVFKN
ncbi:MAG: hypothetical protein COZ08_05175, partial [Bacteroidetes bacterium CG_4_10_14_3_um_filter_42_6]